MSQDQSTAAYGSKETNGLGVKEYRPPKDQDLEASSPEFKEIEPILADLVTILSADEHFFEGRLVPLQLPTCCHYLGFLKQIHASLTIIDFIKGNPHLSSLINDSLFVETKSFRWKTTIQAYTNSDHFIEALELQSPFSKTENTLDSASFCDSDLKLHFVIPSRPLFLLVYNELLGIFNGNNHFPGMVSLSASMKLQISNANGQGSGHHNGASKMGYCRTGCDVVETEIYYNHSLLQVHRSSSCTSIQREHYSSNVEIINLKWDDFGYGLVSHGELNLFGDIEISPESRIQKLGQKVFEGLIAYQKQDGRVLLFRPEQSAMIMKMGANNVMMSVLGRSYGFKNNRDVCELKELVNEGHVLNEEVEFIVVLREMIFRGTDTVAILLEWILARMVLHPEIQSKTQFPIPHDEVSRSEANVFKPWRFKEEDVSIMGSNLRLALCRSIKRVDPSKALGLVNVQLKLA
ncbi:hypothetical protein NE237_033220 [Protea cynaroides]|uniref:Uncharacterized protein n=1 Tax=Protea cynaroides TaxID=273540 RepID=A0A9Q0L4H3_9MAGN|nr:hypothetical protein NE237_033220 [Protea cynaroides]